MTDTNYDETISRLNSNSLKWDDAGAIFGAGDVLPLWVADMDFLSPPAVIEAIKARAAHGIYGYPSPRSYAYPAVVSWLCDRHSWQTKPEWMASTPGVVTALSLAVQTFTQPGDGVIIQPPVYPPFFSCVSQNSRKIIENPLVYDNGDYRMDFDDLARKAVGARMLILCNPHNPVGRVWPRQDLEKLAAICLDNNLLVLSDEIHGDLVFRGHRHIPLASLCLRHSKSDHHLHRPQQNLQYCRIVYIHGNNCRPCFAQAIYRRVANAGYRQKQHLWNNGVGSRLYPWRPLAGAIAGLP